MMSLDFWLNPWLVVPTVLALVTGSAVGVWWFYPVVKAFFLFHPWGKKIAWALGIFVAIWGALSYVYYRGGKRATEKVEENNARRELATEQRQNEIADDSPDELRRRADRWVR